MFDKYFFESKNVLNLLCLSVNTKYKLFNIIILLKHAVIVILKQNGNTFFFFPLNKYFYKQYNLRVKEIGKFLYLFGVIINFTMYNMQN